MQSDLDFHCKWFFKKGQMNCNTRFIMKLKDIQTKLSAWSDMLFTFKLEFNLSLAGLGGSVGCAVRLEIGGRRFNPRRALQHSFVEIDCEIFSTVILPLLLIQEGQLSVSGERMCTILVNCLEV